MKGSAAATSRLTAHKRTILGAVAAATAALMVPFAGAPVDAQQALNEHCVVSVLNRTAQVRPDGSWTLPNIPSGFGPVRARATCVENGVTRSGQSELFTITPGRMNAIPPIVIGTTTPIPQTLTLTGNALLTAVGATSQLTVTATYAGEATQDVTAAATGTTYSTTNALIASVGTGGLVTAVRSGLVIIRATNEGTAGLLQVRVQLAGDSDGDGIPDDIEIAEGLNPNNAVDALEDADRDGLSNVAEFDRGTQIRDPDSDDDSISDGEEAVTGADGFITNPLLVDSDGDGVRDALEIASGSDPGNAASRNLAQALNAISVTPQKFALTVNAVIGEASQQLTVTGQLKDGTTLDLTSTQQGTNYLSNNILVCNFGAEPGRVFAAANGLCTITVTNSGFTTEAFGSVTSFQPTSLSFVAIPGFANNVDVSGNFAYVAAGSTGLQVVSVSNRAAPVVVAALDTPGNANDVRVVGNLAYVADGASGLQIISVANPLAPVNVGAFDTADAWDVVVSDNKAYVADGAAGLRIINVANPAAPTLLGAVDPPGTQKGVDIDPIRNIAVLASGNSGVHVVNVSNPAAPAVVGTVSTGDARDIALKGMTALVADFSRSLTAVDVGIPSTPILGLSTPSNTGGLLQDVVVSGNFTLGADVLFVNGVPIADVSDPANPIARAILNFGNFRDDNGTGVAADASYVYLTAERGITENGTNGDTRLYIGQYLSQQDLEGVAPTVQITAPADSSTFVEGASIPVHAEATDDIAVVGVTFTVNGQPVFTDTSFPYDFNVTAPTDVASVTVGATAVDLGGNQGSAPPVVVNIIPDPGTTVVGRVLNSDGTPLAGATVTALSRSSASQSDGSFSIADVPTALGNIIVSATAVIDGVTVTGRSGSVAPVANGVTNVGDISLIANIRVAVVDGTGRGGGAQAVAQLNDDTFFNFSATLVSASQVDSAAELAAFDVVVLGGSGHNDADWTLAMANAVSAFVNGGGGLVATGWFNFDVNAGSAVDAALEPLVPGQNIPSTNEFQSPGTINILSDHPVVSGIPNFSTGASFTEVNRFAPEPGDTVLASMVGAPGDISIAIKSVGSGRSLYLGPIYLGSKGTYSTGSLASGLSDRLFEQGVAWAAGR